MRRHALRDDQRERIGGLLLEDSHLQRPERLDRLILVTALALS